VGRDVLIVHPEGLIASCYVQQKDWQDRKMDLSVGRVHKNGQVEVDFERLKSFRNPLKDKPRCTDCFCRYGCAGGCHVNNTFPDSSPSYTDFCVHTRIITACRLLEEMQMEDMADELMRDKDALDRIVQFPSDKLSQFKS
jgi:radical SAM protein with 4Fe4S-binding SPASM domain